MYTYDKLFSEYNHTVAQLLITSPDIGDPGRKANFHNTLERLLSFGVLPIINENDTVSTDEIEIGDNDTLSAIVAANVGADLLILPYQGSCELEREAERFIERLRPKKILLTHFDNAFPPLSRSVDTRPLKRMMDEKYPEIAVVKPTYGKKVKI